MQAFILANRKLMFSNDPVPISVRQGYIGDILTVRLVDSKETHRTKNVIRVT
jgi:hypothetical protein